MKAFLALLFSISLAASVQAATRYVDADATGANNGTSWANAYTNLQSALAVAVSGDQIWVAEGVYKPSTTDVTVSFLPPAGVTLRGGFRGTESAASEADPENNITVLSGDVFGDDAVDANGVTLSWEDQDQNAAVPPADPRDAQNSRSVISITSRNNITIEGFTICGGNRASGSDNGGGIVIETSGNITVRNCVLRGNIAFNGSALESYWTTGGNLTLTIEDCGFFQNRATGSGTVYAGQRSVLAMRRCEFRGNSGDTSAGLANAGGKGAWTVSDTLFAGNQSGARGVIEAFTAVTTKLVNVTVVGNSCGHASNAGGLYASGSTFDVSNSIFWDNEHGNLTVGTFGSSTITWKNSIIEGSGGSASWNTAYRTDGGGNLDTDPLFLSPVSYGSAPTVAGDLRVGGGSPAVDAGDNSATTSTTDLAGLARVFHSTIDMGAYESDAGLTWTGATGNLWQTAANWSYGTVPTATDSVTLDGVSTEVFNINLGSSARVAGTLNIDSDTAYTLSGTGGFQVNDLNIAQGAWHEIASDLHLRGAVTTATGSTLRLNGDLIVGGATGTVEATIPAGAVIEQVGGVTISQSSGTARLTVEAGSDWSLTSDDSADLFTIGGGGELVVDGATVTLDTNGGDYLASIEVGSGAGEAFLNLRNGGRLFDFNQVLEFIIGQGGAGRVLVENCDYRSRMRLFNSGQLETRDSVVRETIEISGDDSTFLAENTTFANNPSLYLTRGATTLQTSVGSIGEIFFGGGGTGELALDSFSGTITSLTLGTSTNGFSSTVTIGDSSVTTGDVLVGETSPIALTVTGQSDLSAQALTMASSAGATGTSLRIEDGASLEATGFSSGGGAEITVTGEGSELVSQGGLVFQETFGANTLEIRDGADLSLTGDLDLGANGTLVRTFGDGGTMSCATANLAGTLVVELADGYTPMGGDTFTLFSAAAVNGDFATVQLPDIGPALDWELTKAATGYTLKTVPLLSSSQQSGNWTTAATWNTAVPTSGTAVTIENDHLVTIDSPASAASLSLAGTGQLDFLNGGVLNLGGNFIAGVTPGMTNTIALAAGTQVVQSDGSFLLGGDGGTAEMTMAAGSMWTASRPSANWYMGKNGTASLVLDGAEIAIETEGGAYPSTAYVGHGIGGDATLTLKNGAEIRDSSLSLELIVGTDGATGKMIVEGNSAYPTILKLGRNGGTGIFEIRNSTGASSWVSMESETSSYLAERVAFDRGTHVTTGISTFVECSGHIERFEVGGYGSGTLKLENFDGNAGSIVVGMITEPADSGLAQLTNGSKLTVGFAEIGVYSPGRVLLEDASEFTSSGGITLGKIANTSGSSLEVTDGSSATAASIALAFGSKLSVSGVGSTVTSDGDLTLDDTNGGNTIEVLDNAELHVAGNLTLGDDDTLVRDFGDLSLARVTGTATLGGTLEIRLADGYVPELGHSFPILSATSLQGDFDRLFSSDLAAQGFALLPSIQDGTYSLTLVAAQTTTILSGDWLDDSIWSAAVPTAATQAIVGDGKLATVSAPAVAGSVALGNAGGGGILWVDSELSTGALEVGSTHATLLEIRDGGVVNLDGDLIGGVGPGATGSITLRSGATLNQTGGGVLLGDDGGEAIVNLEPGAIWNIADPDLNLYFGKGGDADVTLNGATLNIDFVQEDDPFQLHIGAEAGSTGSLTLLNGASFSPSGLYFITVGDQGQGTFTAVGVTLPFMSITGGMSGGSGDVQIADSTLDRTSIDLGGPTSDLILDGVILNQAHLSVSGGNMTLTDVTGTVSGFYIRQEGGAIATLDAVTLRGLSDFRFGLDRFDPVDIRITGASSLDGNVITVGDNGVAAVVLEGGSSLTSGQTYLGRFFGSAGSSLSLLDASSLETGTLSVDRGANLSVSGEGSSVSCGDFSLGNNGNNTLGILEGAAFDADGDLALNAGGTLVRTVGDAGTLTVTGAATLGGTLELRLAEGYTPHEGDSFVILSAGSFAGGFETINFTGLPADFTWRVSAFANSYTVTLFTVGNEFAYIDDPDAHASLGRLNVQSGESITIDTDAGTITGSHNFTSTELNTDLAGDLFRVFTFDYIHIASGATVSVVGENHLAILSKSDASIMAPISIPGRAGADGPENTNTAGENGGTGGRLALIAEGTLRIAAKVQLIGGKGGNASYLDRESAGGRGGDGGVATYAASELVISASTSVKGGAGGNSSVNPASGPQGRAGDGGNGGTIYVFNTGTSAISHDKSGGIAGIGGNFGSNGTAGSIYYRTSLDDLSVAALAAFRLQYGLDPGGPDDTADWSGNGIANILYLAFGLGDPNEADIDRSRLPAIEPGSADGTITFSFVRPVANDTGLGIEVLTSTDLSNWSTPDALGLDHLPIDEQTEDLGDGHQRVTQTYTIRSGETGRFYRIDVTEFTGF